MAEKIRDHLPAAGDAKGSSAFKINFAKAAIRARCALGTTEMVRMAEKLAAEPGVQPQVAAISHWAGGAGRHTHGKIWRPPGNMRSSVRRLSVELREKG